MEKNNKNLKGIIAAAAAMAIIVGGYFITNGESKIKNSDSIVSSESEETKPQGGSGIAGGEIGETSMMSFLRYDGKDYRYTFHNINLEKANELKGEKLGTTIAEGMDKEFSSHVEGVEIYTVKGYDDKSVLLGILTTDTDTIIDIYSYYEDSEMKTGQDLLSKMKINDNISSVEILNNMGEGGKIENFDQIKLLLEELKLSENKLEDETFMEGFYGKYAEESKSINIELNDGIVRTFDFYKTGFIFIDGYIFDLPNKEKAFEIYNKL